jgi:hypothetical protein
MKTACAAAAAGCTTHPRYQLAVNYRPKTGFHSQRVLPFSFGFYKCPRRKIALRRGHFAYTGAVSASKSFYQEAV